MARYSAEISQAVRAGGAWNATPIGTRATAIIAEFTGLSTEPSTMVAASRRSNPTREPTRAPDATVASPTRPA